MNIDAIVYTSKHGHTKEYATMLGEKIGVEVYSFEDAKTKLNKTTKTIYMGWIHANKVVNYNKATKLFDVYLVIACGLCDTGTIIGDVRKRTKVNSSVPLFTVQGGLDRSTLKGMDKTLINMLIKGLSKNPNKTPQDARMYELLISDKNYVNESNLDEALNYINAGGHKEA